MIAALAALAFLALADWAWRMTWRTHHGVRAACVLMAGGCAALLLSAPQIGVALLLAGLVVFRAFDRRQNVRRAS